MLEFLNLSTNANSISAMSAAISAFATVVVMILTAVYAYLTRGLLLENKKLRLAGSEPEIIAHLQVDDININIINLVLTNVGSGPAFDISLSSNISRDVIDAKDMDFQNKFGDVPISAMPQGERIVTGFGLGFNLLAEPELPPFNIAIDYKNLRGDKISRISRVDVRQFNGMNRFGKESIEDVVKQLKNIDRQLAGIRSSSSEIYNAMTNKNS